MHISLDAALQRQPLLSTVGDKLLPTFPGAAAAYSLRALNGDANNVVRVRRSGDADGTTNERDFTAEGVALELEDWVNGKLEDTLPADVATTAAAYSLRKVRNDYTGNAVDIRKVSDNIEASVAFDSNGKVSNDSAVTILSGSSTATTLGEFLTEESSMTKDAEDAAVGSTGGLTKSDYISVSTVSVTSSNPISGTKSYLMSHTGTSGSVGYPRLNIPRSSGFVFALNKEYRVQFKIKLISGTTRISGIRFGQSGTGANASPVSLNLTLGQVIEYDGTINATSILGDKILNFQFDGTDGDFEVLVDDVKITANEYDCTVSQWYDQSSNGYDATQDTTGSQPKIAENGSLLTLAGKPTIKPDGSNDFLINENAAWDTITPTNLSCMTVAEGTSLVNRLLWGIGSSANEDADWLVGGGSVSGALSFRGNRVNSATASVSTSGALLLTALDVTGGDGFVNGTAIGSPSTASRNVTADRLVLFTRRGTSSLGTCTDQSISEIIIYASDQSDNRFKIESNINNYYGIYTPAEDGFVEAWYDQSGNGNHAEQPATNLQPKIVSAGSYLGHLDWNGGSQLRTDSGFDVTYGSGETDFSAFWVSTPEGTSVDAPLIATTNGFIVKWENDGRGGFSILDASNPTAGVSSSQLGSAFVLSDDTRQGFVNGSISIDSTGTSTYRINEIYLGFRGASGYGRTYKMKEVIIYSSDQSANRTAIESNIADEYGITLS